MLVHTLTGSTAYNDKQIQVDAHKLMIQVQVPTADASDPKFTIEIKQGGYSKRICREMPLSYLADFAQNKEGFIRQYEVGTVTTITCYIDLTDNGAIPLNNNTYISIDVKDIAATAELKIHVKNSNEIADDYFEYDLNKIPSGQDKQNVMTAGKEWLLLAKSHFTEIQLNYASSRTEKLNYNEMIADADDNNDIAKIVISASGTQVTYGSDKLFIVGLQNSNREPNVVMAEINTDGQPYSYILVSSPAL